MRYAGIAVRKGVCGRRTNIEMAGGIGFREERCCDTVLRDIRAASADEAVQTEQAITKSPSRPSQAVSVQANAPPSSSHPRVQA